MEEIITKKIRKPKKRVTYRSGFEKKIRDYLNKNKTKYEYESLRIPYQVPVENKHYVPDFILKNGIIVEAKGKLDRGARKKMLLVRQQNPDLDIRLLFMRDNYLSKGSKTKYSEWAEKNGFKWSVSLEGHLPSEWLTND